MLNKINIYICNINIYTLPLAYISTYMGYLTQGYCMVHNSLWHKSVLLWDIWPRLLYGT